MSETYQAVERERNKLRQALFAANAKLGMTEHANREGAEWAQWAAKRITALEVEIATATARVELESVLCELLYKRIAELERELEDRWRTRYGPREKT